MQKKTLTPARYMYIYIYNYVCIHRFRTNRFGGDQDTPVQNEPDRGGTRTHRFRTNRIVVCYPSSCVLPQ